MDMVDTHPHVISDDPTRYPIAPLGGVRSGWSKDRPVTTDQFIKHMDEAGVQQAVLVQASTAHGYDNSYAADSVAAHPGRFAGVCCVDAAARDGAEKLRYWIEERGMSGVRLFTAGSTMDETDWLDKSDAHPFWLEAERLNIPVCVQIRRTGIPMLRNVLTRYPNVRMLLDHFAHPLLQDGPPYPQAQQFFDLAQYPNLYLKFSTRNVTEAEEGKSTVADFFGQVIDRFGANRVMWGSNFPGTWGSGPSGPYTSIVDLAREKLSVLPEEHQRWLFAETARSVYPKLTARVAARA